MESEVTKRSDVLGGMPCFTGTRVPVKSLFDHLRLGYSIDGFIEQFPTVHRHQAERVLARSSRSMSESASTVQK
jgi:uncharacterized protein (DUF433 family)